MSYSNFFFLLFQRLQINRCSLLHRHVAAALLVGHGVFSSTRKPTLPTFYTLIILQIRGLPFTCGLGRQAETPREQRMGTPHLRSLGRDTQQVTSREAPIGGISPGHPQTFSADHFVTSPLCGSTKKSSVSLQMTEKMKFEMELPCLWQWRSKTGMPREMKVKSCKYSRCRPHFFQLMEFYHELATSKEHLRSCRHVNISFNFLQVNC